jgi:putative hydrolase of the HAD superfamily
MDRFRAVLFDFFGTLTRAVRRGPWHTSIADRLGCDPAAFLRALDRSLDARCRGVFDSPASALRWVCDQVGADPPPDRLRAALRDRVAAVRRDTRLRPDTLAVLREVRARGLRAAVVSDCAYELPAFLPRLPVAPLLDATVYSVEVGRRKPDPMIFLTACRLLDVDPGQCLYVGDGGGQELTGASRLGMTAVRLAAPDLIEHLFYCPDPGFTGPTVPSLTAAIRLLDQGRPGPDHPGMDDPGPEQPGPAPYRRSGRSRDRMAA